MKTIGILTALVTCATACTVPVEPAPEDVGETEHPFLFCYDGNPCTSDVLVSGVAGNFCMYVVKDGGEPCFTHDYYGTCYPPYQTQDGLLLAGACQRECVNSQCFPGTSCTLVGGRYTCALPGTECFSAADCADEDLCTENTCSAGQCLWRQMTNGETCGEWHVCQEQIGGDVLCLPAP